MELANLICEHFKTDPVKFWKENPPKPKPTGAKGQARWGRKTTEKK